MNEPKYPLSRDEFCRALASGHGRAKLHVQCFGAAEFREEILEAATHNQVCDPQVNGTRGPWLAEMCLAAGVADLVIAQPIPDDHQDREQRVALLLEFARRGIAGARPALYACLGRARYTSDVYASEEIIELDGEAGLLCVVRAMGAWLAEEPEFDVWGYELSVFDQLHGEGSGRTALERSAASDANVRRYLDGVGRYKAGLEQARHAEEPARPQQVVEPGPSSSDPGALLRELVSLRDADPVRLHSAESTAVDLLEDSPHLPGAELALEVYEHCSCAHCRGRAFEQLLERRACPQWVIDECAHDGTEWIREVAARAGSPRSSPSALS